MSPRPFFQTFNEHNKQNMNQDIFNQEKKEKTRSYLTVILNFENYLKLLIVAQKCLTDRKCSQTNKTGLAQCGHSKLGSKILILTYFIIFYTCRHEKKNVLSAGGKLLLHYKYTWLAVEFSYSVSNCVIGSKNCSQSPRTTAKRFESWAKNYLEEEKKLAL